jgi:alkanesulfonate monooxygenase SsuD/methylene tetrahydromethanopterin reductase-like flavin-dependent oxidoreductase (luciferase family)
VGRHADVWHAFGRVEDLKRKSRIVDDAAVKAGRDPSSILRASGLSISEPWDEVRSTARELQDAGFEYLVVSWPGEGQTRVEEFLTRVGNDL